MTRPQKAPPNTIPSFIRTRHQRLNISQEQLAQEAGVDLRSIRELDHGKSTVSLDKVNQVLHLIGRAVGPVPTAQGDL